MKISNETLLDLLTSSKLEDVSLSTISLLVIRGYSVPARFIYLRLKMKLIFCTAFSIGMFYHFQGVEVVFLSSKFLIQLRSA